MKKLDNDFVSPLTRRTAATVSTQPASVLTQIKMLYDTLSKSQKRVADLILRHGIDASYLSSAEIATLADVDRSTVVRTAQALGYEGFADLQGALRIQLVEQTRMTDRMLSATQHLAEDLKQQAAEHGSPSLLSRVVRFEFDHVGGLLTKIPDEQLETAAELIDKARKVYILGTHYTEPIAVMMATLVGFVRTDYVLMDNNVINLTKQLDDMSADDVLFTFAFHPLVRQTLRCMTFAKSVGVQIILMTDTSVSSAAVLADHVLVTPYHLWSLGYSLAPFALLNAIFGALTLRHGVEMQERIKRLGKIDQFLDIFEPEQE